MSRSFGTVVQLNALLKICTKLGLTRNGCMPDLGSDQGANKKASEHGARSGSALFTELFTVRCTVVNIDSAPGYGVRTFRITPKLHSAGGEGGGGGRGGVLEWPQI